LLSQERVQKKSGGCGGSIVKAIVWILVILILAGCFLTYHAINKIGSKIQVVEKVVTATPVRPTVDQVGPQQDIQTMMPNPTDNAAVTRCPPDFPEDRIFPISSDSVYHYNDEYGAAASDQDPDFYLAYNEPMIQIDLKDGSPLLAMSISQTDIKIWHPVFVYTSTAAKIAFQVCTDYRGNHGVFAPIPPAQ
jgi:hypothetical protein